MNKEKSKQLKAIRCHKRIRAKIKGQADCPRLNVFRSNKGMFAQVIDDVKGVTLVSASSRELKNKTNKTVAALELGKLLAEKAIAKKIGKVVFDKGSYQYHGRVKAVADGARAGGLKL